MNHKTMCLQCAHFEEASPIDDKDFPTCAAFPQGIPDDIIRRGFDHRQEYPGDGGVRFEPAEDANMRIIEAFDQT